MSQPPESLRKTFKYKLKPTPGQERELERVLMLCRALYNVALEHRKTAYERCHVCLSRYAQEAELKEIRAELREYANRKAQAYLRRCQRRVAHRTKGSHRRRKAVALLAKAHQHIRNQRQDVHHKEALKLVRENEVIYHEEVQTANRLKNHRLAKSISDAGWSAFLSILAAKAADAGRRVVAVPPAYTSQRCSGPLCGALV